MAKVERERREARESKQNQIENDEDEAAKQANPTAFVSDTLATKTKQWSDKQHDNIAKYFFLLNRVRFEK